jgi:hypothetical protein
MDRLARHRSKRLENKPLARPRCSKTPSTRPNTGGNRQTQTAVPATGEKDESRENSVLHPVHGVQFAIHAKGKVERGVAYLRNNALKGRRFRSLAEGNLFLQRWESSIADKRIHGTTRKQVAACFEEERPHLQPLPESLFPCVASRNQSREPRHSRATKRG